MNSKITSKSLEILAPGGNIESIKAAIIAGANAIYCGLDKFNARNSAEKISFNDLQGIIHLAHKYNCKIFLTLNVIILEHEIKPIINLLNKLINTNIDGVIIQDLGLFYLLSKHFKKIEIHASTQVTTHNIGQIKFLNKFGVSRVNLSRELNINEIKELTSTALKNNISTEVFVHGSYCISFSGICYISSVQTGNSGNRGRCSQPCRDKYKTTSIGKNYPLNLKDNSAFNNLKELIDAGVYSFKIEGRIKKSDYVYTVVNTWRKHIDNYNKIGYSNINNNDLYKVFNRDFTNSYLKGSINKDMFIDNPRDNSIKHLSDKNNFTNNYDLEKVQLKFYAEKDNLKLNVRNKIKQLKIDKSQIKITVYGNIGEKLKINIETINKQFSIYSESKLIVKNKDFISYNLLNKKLKAINDSEYIIEEINIENLKNKLFIPFSELSLIRKEIFFQLNNHKEFIEPINISDLENTYTKNIKPKLSVLISSPQDLNFCEKSGINIYYQIPSSIENNYNELVNIFKNNKNITPWFQSVIIGDDFTNSVMFLKQVKPKIIVTNNTGIAYEAYKIGTPWIAGPYLNIVNSYSLLAIKNKFNCSGAFISNEINKGQIKNIKKPNNFELYYSIYHPIATMTSRQCIFQQVTGCEKHIVDNTCISACEKNTTITNTNNETIFIDKTKGNYNNLYNNYNFLNTKIVSEINNSFSNFFIDLTDIKSDTKIQLNKIEIIKLFEKLIYGDEKASIKLHENIYPTTCIQYKRGL